MRNPNGYGTVVKLSGNRRNPFVVRKNKGWNDKGHPIYDVIGYYPTREAGMIALAKFNESPWNIGSEKTTLAELFQLWIEKKSHKLGKSNLSGVKSAFKHCSKIYGMKYNLIKSYHMQDIVDSCGCGHSAQAFIKNLFYHLDRFALEIDLITRQYSGLVTIAQAPESDKKPFTPEEIQALWNNVAMPWADTVLMLLYSGWRISELLSLRREDVDLTVGTMRGGIKTRAGRGRVVPIHSKIFPFVCERYNSGGEYLICDHKQRAVPVFLYRQYWGQIMGAINAKHTPHECRHTFRSCLDSAGANKVCIDLLLGHKSTGIGERVYTHKTIQELKNAVELIT